MCANPLGLGDPGPGEDELDVLRLLDQVRTVPRLDHTVDLRTLVARDDYEEVRGRAQPLVLGKGEHERFAAVVTAALADELGRFTCPGTRDFGDSFVDFAQEHPRSNELFRRDGHRVLRSRGGSLAGHDDLRAPPRPELEAAEEKKCQKGASDLDVHYLRTRPCVAAILHLASHEGTGRLR